eukprot:scaffold140703_cov17-Tisochrysis_lutea.AAC.1
MACMELSVFIKSICVYIKSILSKSFRKTHGSTQWPAWNSAYSRYKHPGLVLFQMPQAGMRRSTLADVHLHFTSSDFHNARKYVTAGLSMPPALLFKGAARHGSTTIALQIAHCPRPLPSSLQELQGTAAPPQHCRLVTV